MPGDRNIESFWDFSVRTYRSPGVPDACLSLQNDCGADVNMLLFCCWVGAFVGRFDQDLFNRACEFSTQWADEVVAPIRSARTWMKHTGCRLENVPTEDCMALRETIKSVEFESEKLQQEVLESLVIVAGRRGDAATLVEDDVVANLERYAEYAGIGVGDDVRQKFSIIIDAAFIR